MASQTCRSLRAIALVFCAILISNAAAETRPVNQALNKIDVTNSDGKPKRQNSNGEEVDLSAVSPAGQPGIPGSAQQPGQSPFFGGGGGNPFLQQQPFFGNGLGFPGVQQSGYPGIQQGGYPGLGGSFPQNFPQQGYPQFGGGFQGRNVILQNNGRQYLVQELNDNQRIVQKNGKQYLLQSLTAETGGAGLGGLQNFNVPNSALAGLTSAFQQPGALAGAGSPFQTGPSTFPGTLPSGRLTSRTPQRLVINGNGQQFQIDQNPLRGGPSEHFLTQSAVPAQLSAQASGQQYANQFAALGGLEQAYSRANEAGYGFYPSGRADLVNSQGPAKRDAKGVMVDRKHVA